MIPDGRPLAFVDLETTGATATHDRIIEVAIIRWEGGVAEHWSQLVNPESTISGFIEHLTGISNTQVAGAPVFGQIADEVFRRLDGCVFVAHNARFDYAFVKNELQRCGIAFRAPTLCTVKYSRALYPEFRRHNLDSLIERHGLQVASRHRALADAQAIFDFWRLVETRFPVEHLARIQKQLLGHGSLPAHLDVADIDALPEGFGVYLFYGENDLPLYVGKSNRVRQRVLAHFAADHARAGEMSLAQQTRRIDWRDCVGEVDALLLEAALVKELQPIKNRHLRRNLECCSWQLQEQGEGLLRPLLIFLTEVEPSDQEKLYGLFTSRREAQQVLENLAREKGLCRSLLGLEKVPAGRPCSARQMRRCRGACCGEESALQHSVRLMEGLGKLRLQPWPFSGAAILPEGDCWHLVDAWRYFGKTRSELEMGGLLNNGYPPFDRDIYRILVKHREKLRPLAALPAIPG